MLIESPNSPWKQQVIYRLLTLPPRSGVSDRLKRVMEETATNIKMWLLQGDNEVSLPEWTEPGTWVICRGPANFKRTGIIRKLDGFDLTVDLDDGGEATWDFTESSTLTQAPTGTTLGRCASVFVDDGEPAEYEFEIEIDLDPPQFYALLHSLCSRSRSVCIQFSDEGAGYTPFREWCVQNLVGLEVMSSNSDEITVINESNVSKTITELLSGTAVAA